MDALTPEEYWEWRTTIAEMRTAEEKLRAAQVQGELDLMKSKAKILAEQNNLSKARSEYENYKVKLETRLGFSLNGKVIDEKTFEVKEFKEE